MSWLRKATALATGNNFGQRLLEGLARKSHYYMGIGSGAGTGSSGERDVLRMLRRRQAPPYVIFDVGANRGQYLQLVLKELGGQELAIHSFEPCATAFAMLSASAAGDERVRVNQLALSRERGEAAMYYNKPGSVLASLTKRKLDYLQIDFSHSEMVRVETMANYCAEREITKIDLLKVDVEGHEMDVLAGAAEMFARQAIAAVTFEFGGCNIDTRTFFRDFFDFFTSHGMTVFRITPSGFLQAINKYNERLEQFRTTNFIAVQSGKISGFIP